MPAPAELEKKARAKESRRRWRENNPEKYAEIQRRQYERHAERRRAAARVRHHADPDAAHARNRRWNAQNPARRNAANARWRGVPLMAEGKDFVAIIRHDLCAYCSEDGGTVDHIDPVARGGDGDTMNLTGACARCNREKHATPLLAFLLRRLG